MLKKFIGTLAVLILCVNTLSFAQVKIGYMNFQEVLNQMPEADSAAKDLNTFVTQRRQEYQQKVADYSEKESKFRSNSSSMSEEEQAVQRQELGNMQQELNNLQNSIQSQIQQKQQQLLAPIYDNIDAAIAVVAKKAGLDFVLNKKTVNGEDIIFFSAEQKQNITAQVLQQLKNN